MRPRRSLLALLPLLALAPLAVAQDARPAIRPPRDGEQRAPGDETDRRGMDDMPAAPLRVHEWGVWQLDTNGRLSSRAGVAAEAPGFVHRTPSALPTLPELTPAPVFPGGGRYETFDKPVIFLYADTTLDVNVTVRVPHGRPWLYFPDATLGRVQGSPSLRWTGQAIPVGVAVNGASLPDPLAAAGGPPAAWWNLLRAVNASAFVPTGATTYEKFLYYDGEGPFPAGFRAHGAVVTPVAGHVEPIAWQVDGAHWTHLDVQGSHATPTDLGNMVALRVELGAALRAHGLSQPETDALINVWAPALFSGPRRILWLMPRPVYDAMLPIVVNPMPLELVRVGLVIQRY